MARKRQQKQNPAIEKDARELFERGRRLVAGHVTAGTGLHHTPADGAEQDVAIRARREAMLGKAGERAN